MPFPPNTILRINLAWIDNLEQLVDILKKHPDHLIFLDLPIRRTKPPNNKYSLEDLIPIINAHAKIKYFAVSNVESPNDLAKYIELLPEGVSIIPKIESPTGVDKINEIIGALPHEEKVVMLDHDDLYSALVKRGEPPASFISWIQKLVDYCKQNKVVLLRTRGVIFSDTI